MSWEVKHRYTGEVLRSGENNLRGANLSGANLRGANLRGANLSGANLSETCLRGADLGGADLSETDLRGADLGETYLSGADLSGANLRETCLRGADLGGANLRKTCVIDLGQRSDGYQFFLQLREGMEPLVVAGCRYFSLSEARTHWLESRGGTPLGDESQAMLDHGKRLLKIMGAKQ